MNTIKLYLTTIFITLFTLSSCNKDLANESTATGKTNLKLRLSSSTDLQKASTNLLETIQEQKIVSQLNENLVVVATLSPILQEDNSILKMSRNVAKETISQELKENTKFKILVYDKAGNLFTEVDKNYSSNMDELTIDNMNVGENYTIIAYSINSDVSIPQPAKKTTLSDLNLTNISTEFMYFKQVVNITKGAAPIDIKLRHQYSEVRASLEIDQTGILQGSVLTQVTSATISPAYSNSSFNLNTGARGFQNPISNGKELTVSDQSTNPVLFNSALLLTDEESLSTISIPSLTVNDYNYNIKLTGFKILPGTRYNLKIAVACPCLKDALPSEDIEITTYTTSNTPGNLPISKEFVYNDADYGASLDIYSIDNSFNLTINGTSIFAGTAVVTSGTINNFNYSGKELQFQGYNLYPNKFLPPNIEFEDGSRWGRTVNSTNEIWNFDGISGKKAVLKVNIDKNGNVKLYGSKKTEGGEPFYPLRVLNNQTVSLVDGSTTYSYRLTGQLNKVNWKASGNTIQLSQSPRDGTDATAFIGYITGKKIIPCSELIN